MSSELHASTWRTRSVVDAEVLEKMATGEEVAERPELRGDGAWWLQRLGGGSPGSGLLLRPGTQVTLGRGLGVTYQLLAKSCPLMISRNHCSFFLTSDGVCTVSDNQSLNGVWVNGERVAAHQPHVLSEGDVVQLGVPVEPQTQAEFQYRLVSRRLETCAGTVEGSGIKRKQAAEGDKPGGTQGQSGSSKLRRVGEYQHQSHSAGSADTVQHQSRSAGSVDTVQHQSRSAGSVDTVQHQSHSAGSVDTVQHQSHSAGSVDTVQHQQPGTSQLTRDSSGGQNTSIKAQEQLLRAQDQGPGLPTDQERPHRYRDQGPRLPTDQERPLRDRDQGPRLPTDQGRPHRVRDQGPRLPTDREIPHGDRDQGPRLPTDRERPHRDRDQGPRLPTDRESPHRVRDQGPRLPTDQEIPRRDHDLVHGDRIEGHRDQDESHGDWDHGPGDWDQGLRLSTDQEQAQAAVDSVETQISEVLEKELQCIICSEHYVRAVTLGCSHSFCSQCIGAWRQRSAHCPMCWRPILWQTRSVVLDGCIERLVSSLGPIARRHRQRLLQARQELTWDKASGPARGGDPEGSHSQLSEAGPSWFTDTSPSVNGSQSFQDVEPEAAANLHHPPHR
ncbi:E3 ubiquitin-protein ligase rnf8 [Narcine bancroftii]|uniref:E3 ubiquitin-protein ligase rnf8 n=1 Tax=Narcine bancroftii TaxID=1343680 RepID=UPI003831D49E